MSDGPKITAEILDPRSSGELAEIAEAETFPRLEDLRREAFPPIAELQREHRAMLRQMERAPRRFAWMK